MSRALRNNYPALSRAMSRDQTGVIIGRDTNGSSVALPLASRREHAFITGASGSGKSTLLAQYALQLIQLREGFLFIDPHGGKDGPYRWLLIAALNLGKRVWAIDLNYERVIGFNPCACPIGTTSSVIVGNIMDALAISWEGETFSQRPTIERNLSTVLSALVELNLTLCEARFIYDHADTYGLRRYAIEHVKDDYTRQELQRLHDLSQDGRRKREYDQEVIGTHNRLTRILRSESIRAMLGQREYCIDLRDCMDNGDVVLVNLSGGERVYERDADLLGRLLLRCCLFQAKRRQNTKPFSIILDEAHRYLTPDIPTLLAEVRKYGICVVAAMQWLDQARGE